jgi:hypothetical protein
VTDAPGNQTPRHRGQVVEALAAYLALADAASDDPLTPGIPGWLDLATPDLPLPEIGRLAAAALDVNRQQLTMVHSELGELGTLVHRNREVAAQLEEQVAMGRLQMLETLRDFDAARKVVMKQGNRLLAAFDGDRVEQALAASREAIQEGKTTAGLIRAILGWNQSGTDLFEKILLQAAQLEELVATVYARFQERPELGPVAFPSLDLAGWRAGLAAVSRETEAFCRSRRNLVTSKPHLLKRLDAGPATALHQVFARGRRDAESWLKGALTPLLAGIRDSQARLEKRDQDTGKIRDYLLTLDARVRELELAGAALLRRRAGLERILAAL